MLAALSLVSCSSIPDGKIQGDIAQKLTAAGIEKVSVIVQNGVVTLTGQVPEESLRNRSEVLAKSIEGVKSVQSSVIVVAPTPDPTPEIAEEPEETDEPPPSFYDEAFEQATKFVDANTIHCGEVYYLQSNQDLWACKNPFEVELDGKEFESKQLSEADKLNGVDPQPVEWRGNFKINMKLCRTLSVAIASTKAWSEWRDTDWHKPKTITKAKGKWTIDNVSDYVQGGKIVKLSPKQCRAGSNIDIPNAFK
jgi:hypothetical protein